MVDPHMLHEVAQWSDPICNMRLPTFVRYM